MNGWGGLFVALAMLFIAFSASDCRGLHGSDSIAMAIVKYLEK